MTNPIQPMTIYLAGPEVFLAEAVALGQAKRAICHQYGFAGLYPLDNEVEADSPPALGYAISAANEALIRAADIVVANLTPFRGPSADVGTVYELGFARGLGKRVAAYSQDPRLFSERSWQLAGDPQQPFSPGALRDRDGLSIEEFGLHDNLMLEGGIRLAAGVFVCAAPPATGIYQPQYPSEYHRLELFEQVIRTLAQQRDCGAWAR